MLIKGGRPTAQPYQELDDLVVELLGKITEIFKVVKNENFWKKVFFILFSFVLKT